MLKKILWGISTFIIASILVEATLHLPWFSSLEDKFITNDIWGHVDETRFPGTTKLFHSDYVYDLIFGYFKPSVKHAIDSATQDPSIDYKILILGDSISEYGSYPSLLQDMLSKAFPQKHIVVVNTGIVGYETTREATLYAKFGKQLKPDLVIVQTCMNDFYSTPVVFMHGSTWTAVDGKYHNYLINAFLFNHSKLYRFLTLLWLSQLTGTNDLRGFEGTMEQKMVVQQPLQKILQQASMANTPYRVLVIPIFNHSRDAEVTGKAMLDVIQQAGGGEDIIDLTQSFIGDPIESFEDHDAPGHPNEKGNRVMAGTIFTAIQPLVAEKLRTETQGISK